MIKMSGIGRRWILAVAVCLMMGVTGCGGSQGEVESEINVENAAESNEGAVKSDTPVVVYELPSEPEEAGVYVEPIENLPEDFIRGVDISSIIAQENSGVVYYNEDGEEQDIFQTLAQNGVNYVRVRVWNDPYDDQGRGYGGGNNDTAIAAKIGERAAEYGMKLCVDYHYSDFWADPSKQQCPKAWEGMSIEDKSEALYEFTKESLSEIISSGADVGMVQIGNEINNGISGETDWTNRRQLLQAGSKAVRETSQELGLDIQIAVHFTDISDKDGTLANAQKLQDKEIDYDIFAVSYYPFWHGTLENLTEVLKEVSSGYDKKVMVAENSYPYTVMDGDGFANSIGEADIIPEYNASVQGQTNEIRDVCAAVVDAGEAALGIFYWEPAWIPVGVYDESAADVAQVLASNKEKWENDGSGWASSYSKAYDPNDAGVYYGGSSWDNQALFDFEGHPLESLKVFKYLQCGTIVEQAVESIPEIEVNVALDAEEIEMPKTVEVALNNRTVLACSVVWDEEQLADIDTSEPGEYEINGYFSNLSDPASDTLITQTVATDLEQRQLEAKVVIDRLNLIANSSFEEADTSMWEIESSSSGTTDFQDKESDAYSGNISLHFYSEDEVSFTVKQTVTGLEAGTYEFGIYLQGGDAGENADMYIFVDNDGEELVSNTRVEGWCVWQNPVVSNITVGDDGTLTVGASINCAAKGWGTLDDFYLYKID